MKKLVLLIILILPFNIYAQSSLIIKKNMEGQPKIESSMGNVKKHKPVSSSFTIKNTLKTPLVLISPEKNKKGECTVTQFPKAPIMPGDSASLQTTCKFGYVETSGYRRKTLYIIASAAGYNKRIQLIHKAFVYKYV